MWYAVQTPAGREAEMAEKLNRVYSGESDKPCFVLSKERSWRMGGIYHIGVEPMFPGYIFVDTDDAGELEQKIGILALDGKLNSMPNNLSGGQQQRVAIARALVSKPAIILADEPTGNLDSRTSSDVLGLLKVTSQKFHQTLVMITHNNEIAQLADRIIRIEDGKIAQ